VKDPYENHRDEWREEEAMYQYERAQARKWRVYPPNHPDIELMEDEDDAE